MRLSLATKISLSIIGVLALSTLSSLLTIISARHFETFQETLIAENLQSVKAAEELEIALLEQRGYVSAFILDEGNDSWLDQLKEKRINFDKWLDHALDSAHSDAEREILVELDRVQDEYARRRQDVVSVFEAGNTAEAKHILLHDVAELYQRCYELCEKFISTNEKYVDDNSSQVRTRVKNLTTGVTITLIATLSLGSVLLWLFFNGVLIPLRRLARTARSAAGEVAFDSPSDRVDDLRELRRYMGFLMTDVVETRSDLADSRRQLAHAERLASVGRLAASVAHEIRNPLTSIKMWLYSLRRGIGPDEDLRQKVDIVSHEINRLEDIVRSFLEFSRPQKLTPAKDSLERIIGQVIELAALRLEEHEITVDTPNLSGFPAIWVDAEQLSQVFLNLLNNAIDAMPNGGTLQILCETAMRGGRPMLAVRVQDSGPGMPQDVQDRIFEPFFTTKPEGTGLGLVIAASVMARHGGALALESSDSSGTRWVVWIPMASSD